VDGIIILTQQGELVHANQCARRICSQQGAPASSAVLEEIWCICQSLIESRELFPNEKIVLESEIELDELTKIRIRVRWLQLGDSKQELLLVILEDPQQATHNIAVADAKKYNLTPREAEVWLLRRANLSYKEIAAKLYITINTVKKHLKNIYAKQQEMLWLQECQP
jgi:DNA-binding CsgD family transcriptional regulator